MTTPSMVRKARSFWLAIVDQATLRLSFHSARLIELV
jgi:hypothetical protein